MLSVSVWHTWECSENVSYFYFYWQTLFLLFPAIHFSTPFLFFGNLDSSRIPMSLNCSLLSSSEAHFWEKASYCTHIRFQGQKLQGHLSQSPSDTCPSQARPLLVITSSPPSKGRSLPAVIVYLCNFLHFWKRKGTECL